MLELVGSPSPTLDFFTLANDLGAFKKYGLDVTIRRSSGGGPQKIQALIGGQADAVVSDVVSTLAAVHQGSDVKAIFVPTPNYTQAIVSQKKYTSVTQLKNQSFTVPSLGGAARFLAISALQHYGIKPGDIHWQVGQGEIGRLDLVETGHVAATLSPPNEVVLLQHNSKFKNLHVLLASTGQATGTFPNFTIDTTTKIIQSKGPALTRLAEGLMWAMRDMQQNPNDFAKAAIQDAGKPYTTAEMVSVGKQLSKDNEWGVNGGINLASIQKIMNLYFSVTKNKANSHLSKPSQVVDTQFVNTALTKLGMAKVGHDVPDWRK